MRYVRYEKATNELYKSLDSFIRDYAGGPVILFGTSVIMEMVTLYLQEHDIRPSFIVDNNKRKQGYHIFGCPIFSPDKLLDPFLSDARILIASSFQNQMISQLEGMGYIMNNHIIRLIDLPKLMNDFEHIEKRDMIPVGMDECKKEMVRTMELLNEVCVKNGLRYYIVAGTLIGAVRHKGFIPWDDDIDIVMPLKDLYRLAELVKEHPELHMLNGFDEEVDFYGATSELYTEKYLVDSNHFPMQYTAGVLIDVYPLVGLPGEGMCQENLDYMEGYRELDMKQWGVLYDKEKCKKACKEMFRYLEEYPFEESTYTASASEGYTQTIMPYEYFGNPVWLDFENIKIMAPEKYETMLVHAYGDYMQLPPPEERVQHHYYHAYQFREEP